MASGQERRATTSRDNPRGGARAVREVSRRILARARPRARLSDRIRRGADRSRLSRRADPGGIRRQRARRLRAAAAILEEIHACRLQRRRLPRPDVHDGHDAAARQRRAEEDVSAEDRQRRIAPAGVRRHRADIRHRHTQRCAPPRGATATTITSSTARRSGPRAPSIPT